MSSDSDDEVLAGIGTRRQLRRRGAAAASAATAGPAAGSGRRLRGIVDSEEDSGSEIEQAARRKKGKKIPLPEEDDAVAAGPSGMSKQQLIASDDSSEWESDWNSDEEKLLKQGGQEAAAALVSKLGYASDSSTSSGDGDKCPICLLSLNDQEVGVPEVCEHMFCAPCIEEWAKNVTTCPIDRKNFDSINVYASVDRKKLVRKNQVQTKPPEDIPVLEDHELTYCEICRRPDREDTMLLCDACNLGFHMECLSPPLEVIPTGSWYCDCCFASASEEDDEEVNDLLNDLNEIGGVRQTRLRERMLSPPRIVRTRQSERIRSTILTRTSTAVRLNVVNDDQEPGPSTRRTARTATTAAAAPKSVRKRRKRRTRRKILRMIISEYDVNDDNEKFAVRRKKIYKTLKRLSKKRSKRKRTSRGSRSTRQSAGITPGMEGAVADLQHQRFSTGIPTLKIFGGANDLDYFSDDDGQDDMEADVSIGGRGETAVANVRAVIRNPLGRRRALKSGFEPSSSSGPVDLLGSIMQDQARWHSKQGTKDAKIDNGKIIFQVDVPSKKTMHQPPGATQAGLGQNSQGNISLPETSSAGTADSTSTNRDAGGNGSVEASSSSAGVGSSSGAGGSGDNGKGNDLFDPLDTSIFVDLPPLQGKENEKEKKKDEIEAVIDTSIFVDLPPVEASSSDKDKEKKNDGFDMFGTDSPIPLPPHSPPPASSILPILNPAPEISTTTTDDDPDALAPGTSRGFGKFKFTMTSKTDDSCPNMSMYSSETLEYTKTAAGEEPYDPLDSELKTDDEGGERDEDLVQLDDEDVEPPAAKLDQEGIPNGTDKLPTGDPDHDAFDSDSEDELKKIEEVSGEPEPSGVDLEALTPPLRTTVAAALVTSSTASVIKVPVSVASSVDDGPVASSAQGGEEDRSYTPCLDEKYQEARREHDRSGTTPELPMMGSPKEGIDGMDTELISDEDENTFKEDELAAASSSKAASSGARKKDATFKKVNKKGKERNYRGEKEGKKKDRNEDKENDSRRSRERDRDRDRNRSRRPRPKELPRYDVRTVIAKKRPKVVKDPFGRDVTPKPVSKTRSRSRSRSPVERRREMSISLSPEPPRRYNRRRSMSPRFRARNRTPPGYFRRSRTPELGGRPMRLLSRSRSPIMHRHRNPSMSRTPSPPPPVRHGRIPVMAPPKSVSPELRAKSKKLKKKKQRQAASPSRSRSPSEGRGKKKSKKSRKKKNKHRGASPSGKKKKRRRSSSPMMSPSRSRSRSPIPAQTTGVLTERFAKVRQQNSWTPPPPTRPKTNGTNLTVILTNEEALAKQAKERERKRKEARRRERARGKNRPSKEVFTSGDNILVSVSFNDKNLNKENQQAAGEGEVSAAVAQKRMKDIAKKRAEAEKAKRKRLERLKKTRGEAPKPVVIIDLDRSPFRVITPSPRAVIVLSDSDAEKEKERREGASGVANGQQSASEANGSGGPSLSQRKSPAERHEEDMFGPKTPPGFPSQPQPSQSKPQAPKFTMQVKSKLSNLRPLNPLYEPGELDEGKTPERMDNAESSNYNMVGPNTPPEPAPQSPSPDVYDPFEPTKSPSPSPSRRDNASIGRLSDLDDAVLPSSSSKVDGPDSGIRDDPKADSQNQDESMNGEQEPAPRGSKITILSNIVISQPTNSGQGVVSGSGVSASQNNTGDDSDVIFDDFVSSSAPAPSNNVGYSTSSSNPIKSYSTAANSSSLISKLPLPPGAAGGQKFSDFINPTDSPYSPGASDFDDLFEPGGELDSPPPPPTKQSYKPTKIPTKGAKKGGAGGTFDNLFGSSPVNNFGKRSAKKGAHKRRGKPKGDDEEDLSKLSTKERFLKKLNRLERVVEEVKLVIKPFYNKKQINKEEYKDILRRAVPKICHSRTGEINPIKIQKLIKAYVHKVRARRRLAKKAGAGGGGPGGPVGLPGVNVNPLII